MKSVVEARKENIKKSLSARRAWIEIYPIIDSLSIISSLSARRAWIEIKKGELKLEPIEVALRKESVD